MGKPQNAYIQTLGPTDTLFSPGAALTATAAAAPAGGTGTTAGAWDTAANRDAAITLINNLRTRVSERDARLTAHGLIS